MRKLLYALISAVLFAPFAHAAGNNVAPPSGYFPTLNKGQSQASQRRFAGKVLSTESILLATTDRFVFGFQSNWVSICLQGGAAVQTIVYFRFEFNASSDLWSDLAATTSALYISGDSGVTNLGNGPAMVITGGGDGTDARCMSIPTQARGLTIHQVTASQATLDINAW